MKKLMASVILFMILITSSYGNKKPELLFYCGITMVEPMKEMAKIIEQRYNCNITISQGGSKDLYDSLKFSKKGDLYLPGSDSYRKKYLKDGYLLDDEYIGFNQAAIFVQKGNPKNIKSLDRLLDEDIATILCNPKSGSIGKMTKKLLTSYKGEDFYYDTFDYAAQIGTDSRNLNKAIADKSADMTINWRATGYFPENKKYIDIINIDEKYAPKKRLVLNLLSFSKNKEIAKNFMKFAASKEGQSIMKKYGFR
ncbi:MAG: substrate-binding domain-containing protein [Campylobacterota bacterium]|nr:substrate-binding domain-containing protein [Campylobacterota bacterium]